MLAPTEAGAAEAAATVGRLPPQIYLVDEDPSMLGLMSRALRASGYAVVAWPRPDTFLQRYDPDAHGCVVLGFARSDSRWLLLLQTLAKDHHHMPVIVVSPRAGVSTAVQAMRNGAFDFLAPVGEAALVLAVREALDKDRRLATVRAGRAAIESRLATLTASEHLVLSHVLAGHLNRQIAAQLGRALKTIKTHRARAMRKMRAHSAVLLARTLEHTLPRNLELVPPALTSRHAMPNRSMADEVEVA